VITYMIIPTVVGISVYKYDYGYV